MRFAFLSYWPILILIPVGVILLAYVRERTQNIFLQLLRPEQYTNFLPGIRFGLRIAGISLMIMALLGPAWGSKKQTVNVLGREIYLVVDVSASMNATDIKPSRLEKVRQELKKMVKELRGDKIGIIVFTSKGYVQCPLTKDYQAVNLFLDLMKSEQFSSTGTSFRDALLMAYHRFTQMEQNEYARKSSRIIVLISDGEDFGANYTSVTDRLKKEGIVVFPVGIGTYEGAPVPNYQGGKLTGYKLKKDGTVAKSILVDESLMQIAEFFGTDYTRMDTQIDDLRPVTEMIKMQSASVLESRVDEVETNRYFWFLFPGILLLLVSLFLMPVNTETIQEDAS